MQNSGSLLLKNSLHDAGSLVQRDLCHVWHPFTQAKTDAPPIPIIKGEGPYLYAEDGSRYIDAISSWWVNLHGHAHPYISAKISEQAQVLEQVIFAGFTHPKAVELAERLTQILPGKLSKIFYTDNGSTAVEAALKMAIQFRYNQNPQTKKMKVISFKEGYHGDTFGALSAAGANDLNRPFWPYLFESVQMDPPQIGQEEESKEQLKKILRSGECACFIFEPLIQGTAGMKMHSAEGLDSLIGICKEYEVITIADEIMAGFGRTGPLFASERLENTPDIICLSKGITGGFLPLGAVACHNRIFEAFLSGDRSKALLHGHSYTANPMACAAALASLDLLEKPACTAQRSFINASHLQFRKRLKNHPKIRRCEVLGTILAVEYQSEGHTSYFHTLRDKLYRYFISQKILLRPLGNVVYVLPPYCIQSHDLEAIYQAILYTLENLA